MDGLIILRGMTFRGKGAYSRIVTTDHETCKIQFEASASHLKLIENLASQGHNIHVAFDTITTDQTQNLLSMFGSYLKVVSTKSVMDPEVHFALRRSIYGIMPLIVYSKYDFVLIIRNDMFLKDDFFKVFNPCDDIVKFISVQSYDDRKTIKNNPRINDCIFYVPNRYFELLEIFPTDVGNDHHHMLDIWLKEQPNLEYGFYLDGYHGANTETDRNPLYKLINRPEADSPLKGHDLKYPEDF